MKRKIIGMVEVRREQLSGKEGWEGEREGRREEGRERGFLLVCPFFDSLCFKLLSHPFVCVGGERW